MNTTPCCSPKTSEYEICFMCYGNNKVRKLYKVCNCNTSVHSDCLIYWIYNRPIKRNLKCEVCLEKYKNVTLTNAYVHSQFIFLLYKIIHFFMELYVNYLYILSLCASFITKTIKKSFILSICLYLFVIFPLNIYVLILSTLEKKISKNLQYMTQLFKPSIKFKENKYYKFYFKSPLFKNLGN
jgi:hypothetical protein